VKKTEGGTEFGGDALSADEEEISLANEAKAVIHTEIAELQRLADRVDASFSRAVLCLKRAVADGHKIVVIGVGKSENVATKIAATFNSTGAPSVVLDCQNALHGDLGIVTAGDVILALSYSGETNEMLDLLPHLLRRRVLLIAVTGHPESSLGRFSEVTLDVHVTMEACPLNLAPTCSTTNMLALGDALAMVLLKARGFRAEDFAELHPGGNLGRRLLTRVSDIMRSGAQLAFATPDESISEVLASMTRCKAGAVLVVDENKTLHGIFTHGDFVRCYQSHANISSHSVKRYMTINPVSIGVDRLAQEAVCVLSEHKIDEIVVLDDSGRAVGLVDVQDLSRAQIF
jgi:arabinose-5-phosphate isomerase